ncbi:AI-2E family transporter [uncultured Thiohalocapsa sp.]|jgi:putative permease|uniref:AI-2E family transporter n=1 Tax=uncultured Thiohalocapsa sp. TaxID=768990 RepID=UPI0025F631F4|nr:AI-2E family transporter [uncultured Thiohalocapsa sp.]
MQVLGDWFRRHFSDPQVMVLAVSVVIIGAVVLVLGEMLLPVLASIVIAYLLEGFVLVLERHGWPRLAAVLLVFVLFLAFVISVLVGVLPLVYRQVSDLVQQLPQMLAQGQHLLMALPDRYPELVSAAQIDAAMDAMRSEVVGYGQTLVSVSLSSLVGVITLLVYLILMPLLVFFFLKDKHLILGWFRRYLPRHRAIAGTVWRDVDRQLSNYVRGKFWEILIVWAVSFATFTAFDLKYAMLLALLVGLSVIIPYIGASVVTVPVVLIAWFQWGWGAQFLWLTLSYLIIQALDGNVLVPVLFSEVVNLHPVAIIVAILVFGGIWGFWGVFFAIPLATVVQAILSAWPRPAAPRPGGDALQRDA